MVRGPGVTYTVVVQPALSPQVCSISGCWPGTKGSRGGRAMDSHFQHCQSTTQQLLLLKFNRRGETALPEPYVPVRPQERESSCEGESGRETKMWERILNADT